MTYVTMNKYISSEYPDTIWKGFVDHRKLIDSAILILQEE